MKVAFVLSQIMPNGPFLVAKDIYDSLMDAGLEIDVYYVHGDIRQNYKIVPKKLSVFNMLNLLEYDVIHSHGFRADVFTHVLSILRLVFRRNFRIISTVHQYNNVQTKYDYGDGIAGAVIEAVWKISLKSKDVIVGLTEDMAKFYNSYLSRRDCIGIHNGRNVVAGDADAELLKIIRSKKKEYTIIGGAGHLILRKGFDLLIRCLADDRKLFAVILGDGPEKESLINLADQLGVSDRVLLCGFQKNPTEYYKHMDLFALTSRAEGFSLVIAEAAAVGIPCISANFQYMRELYHENELPLFQIGSVEGISAAINLVMNDHKGYAERIQARYLKCYTREVMAKSYYDLYCKQVP